MWYDESVFYQIYPLGFVGAPQQNDGVCVSRINKVNDWIEHMKWMGINAVYFSPVFESDAHGYDTRDYRKIDCRLGTNDDFKNVVENLHNNGIRVVIDGVFNHVGRGFFAFQDVLSKRWESKYKDWFIINFDGNNSYNDGLWYEGWEGYYNLVKLNLRNQEVVDYIFECIKFWRDEFNIDGLRLDVAYCLDNDFLKRLRVYTDSFDSNFLLLGELLHGDYNLKMNDSMLHTVTNYECYKGLYSSFNSMNMFEIAHSINRQSGHENWCLYRNKHLFNFVDNHDVNRIASTLVNKAHLPLIYGLLMAMPGIPCIYYGSEWGVQGVKADGSDAQLRKCYEKPEVNELTKLIKSMAEVHKKSSALLYGEYDVLLLTNRQYIFQRTSQDERVIVAVNADGVPYTAHFNAGCTRAVDLITGNEHDFGGGSELMPYSVAYWKCEI